MAIQNRGGNFADFDPFKMLPREFAYSLDTEELYYCVAPGNVKRVATKEDIVQILDTNQEAYDGLQQLLIELENETVASGILNDISDLLVETAQHDSKIDSLENRTTINETNIAENTTNLDTHLADYANLLEKTKFKGALRKTDENLSIPNESDFFPTWRNVIYDYGGFATGTTTRMTVPEGVSKVVVKAGFIFGSGGEGGYKRIAIMKNGGFATGLPQLQYHPDTGGSGTIASSIVGVVAGDYFTVRFTQNSGASVDLLSDPRTWFSIEAVE